jgi:hypothetical protein
VEVAAGDGTCYALTDAGEVFAWGQGSKGQLGTGAGLSSSILVTAARSSTACYAHCIFLCFVHDFNVVTAVMSVLVAVSGPCAGVVPQLCSSVSVWSVSSSMIQPRCIDIS